MSKDFPILLKKLKVKFACHFVILKLSKASKSDIINSQNKEPEELPAVEYTGIPFSGHLSSPKD